MDYVFIARFRDDRVMLIMNRIAPHQVILVYLSEVFLFGIDAVDVSTPACPTARTGGWPLR